MKDSSFSKRGTPALVRDVEPLTAAERWTDAFGSFDEAIRAIGERYRAGEDINRGYFKRTK